MTAKHKITIDVKCVNTEMTIKAKFSKGMKRDDINEVLANVLKSLNPELNDAQKP